MAKLLLISCSGLFWFIIVVIFLEKDWWPYSKNTQIMRWVMGENSGITNPMLAWCQTFNRGTLVACTSLFLIPPAITTLIYFLFL